MEKIIKILINFLFPENRSILDISGIILKNVKPEHIEKKINIIKFNDAPETYSLLRYRDFTISNVIKHIKDDSVLKDKKLKDTDLPNFTPAKKLCELISLGIEKSFISLISQIMLSNKKTTVEIIPIPTTPEKIIKRGFNHCSLILKLIFHYSLITKNDDENEKGISFDPAFYKINENLLLIKNKTGKQFGRKKNERLFGIKDSFKISETASINSEDHILYIIFDDVTTTGSTIREAYKTLSTVINKENIVAIAIAS